MEKQASGILHTISPEIREKLMKTGSVSRYQKRDLIFSEQDEMAYVYILLDGIAALFRHSHHGEIKIMFLCTEGEVLNEMISPNEKTTVGARALSDVTALKIPCREFESLMKENFELVKAVFDSLALKTRRLYHQAGNANGTFSLEKHLAAKIWKLARDHGKNTPAGRQIEFEITVTLLSQLMGAQRESISRILSQMKKKGYIIHEKGILTVPDMQKLRDII